MLTNTFEKYHINIYIKQIIGTTKVIHSLPLKGERSDAFNYIPVLGCYYS